MSKTFELREYINKIEKSYIKARKEFEGNAEELDSLEISHKERINSGELSSSGQRNEYERYGEKKRELLKNFEGIRTRFADNVQEIRKSVQTLFRNKYCVNPEDLDLKAVELLKRDMLTASEILEIALNYKDQGNLAMYRYCGTFINPDEYHDGSMKRLGLDAKRALQRDDLELIDSFTDVCLKGLRDDVSLSNGINSKHDEFYNSILESSEDISISIDTPWESE